MPRKNHESTVRGCFLRGSALALTAVLLANVAWAGPPQRGVSGAAQPADAFADVFGELSLRDGAVVSIEFDPTPGLAQRIEVSLAGVPYELDLVPHSVRSANYQVLVDAGDGVLTPAAPGPERTLRGTVVGFPESAVAASIDEDGLFARIRFANGDDFWVEPLGRLGFRAGEHIVYHNVDVIPPHGICATEGKGYGADSAGGDFGLRGPFSVCETELACDADFEYFSAWGSVANVEGRINTVINAMNIQYEGQVGITHLISAIVVRSTSNDPYVTFDPSGILNEFRTEWVNNQGFIQRDVAELFTGKNLNGNVIGIAWLSTICGSLGYNVVQSDFTSNFACVTDLSAHELGHSWGAGHCSCPGFTMNPSITCANVFHPSATIPSIISFRDSRNCLNCTVVGDLATLTNMTVVKGTLLNGNLTKLEFSDNKRVRIQSAPARSRQRMNLTVDLTTIHLNPAAISVSTETGANNSVATTKISLRDFNAGSWVLLGSFSQSKPDLPRVFLNVANPGRFVDGSGNIRVRVFMRSSGAAFKGKTDQVQVAVQP